MFGFNKSGKWRYPRILRNFLISVIFGCKFLSLFTWPVVMITILWLIFESRHMICLRKYLDRSQQFQDWILILSNSIINTIGFIQVRKMIKKLIYIIMYLLAYFQLPFVLTISHSILLYYFTYCSLYYIDEKIMGLVNTGKFHFIAILTINLYQHIFITLYSFLSYYLWHSYLIAANISIIYALPFINISSETIITLMHHHHDKFNISKQYLSEKIFIPEPPQQG